VLGERRRRWETIVFEARGGKKGAPGAQNTEYAEGLRLVLEQLKAEGIVIADAVVGSRATAPLSGTERRLDLGEAYTVAIGDAEEIGKAQEAVGRAGAKGGNATRRIRLTVASGGPPPRTR
jgi:hypothetical protein